MIGPTTRSDAHGRAQRGFVLGYALGALLTLSLVAGLMARLNSARDTGAIMVEARNQLTEQASLIRTKLLACAALYPNATAGIPFGAFPADADAAVNDLVCPGAPSGTQPLWLGDDAIAAPTPPRGFSAWRYTRDAAHTIHLRISLASGQSAHRAAVVNAAKRIGSSATVNADGGLDIRLN